MSAARLRARNRSRAGSAPRNWSSWTVSIRSGTTSARNGCRKRREQQILRCAQDDRGLTNPRDELERALIVRRDAGKRGEQPPTDTIHAAVEAGGGAAAGAHWYVGPRRAAVARVFDRGGDAGGKRGRRTRHLVLHRRWDRIDDGEARRARASRVGDGRREGEIGARRRRAVRAHRLRDRDYWTNDRYDQRRRRALRAVADGAAPEKECVDRAGRDVADLVTNRHR